MRPLLLLSTIATLSGARSRLPSSAETSSEDRSPPGTPAGCPERARWCRWWTPLRHRRAGARSTIVPVTAVRWLPRMRCVTAAAAAQRPSRVEKGAVTRGRTGSPERRARGRRRGPHPDRRGREGGPLPLRATQSTDQAHHHWRARHGHKTLLTEPATLTRNTIRLPRHPRDVRQARRNATPTQAHALDVAEHAPVITYSTIHP